LSETEKPIVLMVRGPYLVSKKNHHYPGKNGNLLIDQPVKDRMKKLEDDILFSLYSLCQTEERETDLELVRQLQTRLSKLLDDSLKEVPKFMFDTHYVSKGQEGVNIIIERIL
jgi:hypothetical protein